MKKTFRKTICLMIVVALLLPAVAVAKTQENSYVAIDDIELNASTSTITGTVSLYYAGQYKGSAKVEYDARSFIIKTILEYTIEKGFEYIVNRILNQRFRSAYDYIWG